MAQWNGPRRIPTFTLLLAIVMLALLELSAAATETKFPTRPFRYRSRFATRPSEQRSSAAQVASLRSPRRFRGYPSSAGESSRRVNYAPLKQTVQSQENKQRASESVHVVSVQSKNSQGKSQPVYRAAVTKLKIPEDDHLMEPKDLSVRVISSQSVLVTWVDPMYEKMPKSGANRLYTIRYREKGESARWDYKKVNIRRAMIDDLIPDAMYEFSVRISQGDKEGTWSSSVFQRTPESAPTSAPDGLYVEPLNGKKTAVRVMWDELSDSNGRIKEYIISYAPAIKPFGAKSMSYSGTTTSAIIDGLQPGERYIFKIRAANRRGQGPQSKAFTVTMPASSTAGKNVYHQPQTDDLQEGEEEEKLEEEEEKLEEEEEELEEEEEEEKQEQEVESQISASKSSLGNTKVKLASTTKSPKKKVSYLVKSSEMFEDTDTTTAAPKTLAPPQRRRIRPIHSRTKVNGQKSPSAVPVDKDNETKTLELEDSDKHSTSERTLPSSNIDEKMNGRREHTTDDYASSKDVLSKFSHVDTTSTESESRSDTQKVDNESDLEASKSLPASPISVPVNKGSSSTNQRNPFSRVSTGQGKARLSSTPTGSHQPVKMKPHSKATPLRKINPDSKKQSHSALLLNPAKESISSVNHNSRSTDLEPDEEKQSHNERKVISDVYDKGHPLSSGHSFPSAPSDAEKSNQDKKNVDKKVKHHDYTNVKDKTQADGDRKAKKHILPVHKSTKSTVTTTLRTELPTTPLTTTTESSVTTSAYKSNRTGYNEYEMKAKDTDVKISSPNQQAPVHSLPGKSALSLLEYYRRRSYEVKNNVGKKIQFKSNLKTPQTVNVHTTTALITTTLTTLPPDHFEYKNHDKSIEINANNGNSRLRKPPAPSKPLSKDKTSDNLQDKTMSSSTITSISKKLEEKASSSLLVKAKPKDVYDLPITREAINTKVEPSRTVIKSRTLVKTGNSDSKKATDIQVEKQTVPGEEVFKPNLKSPTVTQSLHSSDTSHTDTVKSSHGNSELKKVEDAKETKLTKHTSNPSSLSKVGSTMPQQATSAPNKNTEREYQMGNKPSGASTSYLQSNRNIGYRRTPINKSSISPSEIEKYLKYGLAKSKLSTEDSHKAPVIPQEFEKEHDPTPSSRTRQSTHSTSGGLKHRNINGNAQERSENLEDEEGLSAPQTVRERTPKKPTSDTNYKNAVLNRKSNKATTTARPTTNYPQTTTRASHYRLLPSVARKLNIGRSSISTTTHLPTTSIIRTASPTYSSRPRIIHSRFGFPGRRPFGRPSQGQGASGRQIPMRFNGNGNVPSTRNGKLNGQRIIYGPQGTKWVVDLNRGLVLNPEGRYLQDSTGKPLRIKLGGDGRTVIDMQGTPVVSPDGLPLFGHGRFSKPVASPQDKPVLSLGGRPLRGLEVARTTKIPTTRMTTTIPTTRPTTTTPVPTTTTTTTTPEPTTPEPTTLEPTTEEPPLPTCPPGSYTQYDEEGNLIMGPDDKPDCYEEDSFSGEGLIATTKTPYLDIDQVSYPCHFHREDYEMFQTTVPPMQETEFVILTEEPEIKSLSTNLVSEFDVAGKKRFTAPYVSYISKDPNTPCSLTDALEHFQVENLADIIPKDMKDEILPPQKIAYNITVVAVEGCHSFVILDWAKPKKGDFITGYLVYSASYDDFLRNKWSTRTAAATNFPVENLKPNTRYYFKIQAKNPHGFGPMSSHVSFVTESDNPLLIVRPPGGEPIWIPFAFKHDSSFSGCSGKQYVKRTWYRKFVGVVLCNSLRYKIYLSENLRDTFYSIGDSWGRGEDHCQFVDSYMDGRTGPLADVDIMPMVDGYYRQYIQEPVMFGRIGFGTPHNYVGWYECGVPIPGKW
ncbi:fibronectin type III domain-containing 1 [Pelobates cultripes]|uniref:Fibronectin type III domain-containing 1 n=1 Tax=Pelobates cultripes TaxID=61616 RepID=A0AAD1VSD5_PELCU|nr:fibronectin type III domain-containing 1 [Pelobates cultripes]